MIDSFQGDVNPFGSCPHLLFLHRHKEVFQSMGQLDNRIEIDHLGSSLDRMGCPHQELKATFACRILF